MALPPDPTQLIPTTPPLTSFRKEARIQTVICTEPLCFAAIPKDCTEAHQKWHEMKRRKQ